MCDYEIKNKNKEWVIRKVDSQILRQILINNIHHMDLNRNE